MSNVNKVQIIIGGVYNNGVLCSNPVVLLASKTGLTTPCPITDPTNITVEVPVDQVEEGCLNFIIQCEDCGDCPPVEKKVCLCTNSDDCPDCHYCLDGLCISECTSDQFCVNNACVDCDDSHPCPNNQICLNGTCVCPPGYSLNPITQRCENCSTDNDCPACSVCINGNCVSRECYNGVCDVETGNCVGCLSTGDCTGIHECCINKTCECCTGYVRVNGVCIVAPDCTTDNECNDPCLTCILGICTPIACPAGQVCYNGTCREECDCDTGGCKNKSDYCAAASGNKCACIPCEGDCVSGCKYPCYCSPVTNTCVNDPCINTTCTDGTDCGDGCGCLNGQCVPCDKLSCSNNECANVLGCKCQGTVCVDADVQCSGTCATSFDCGDGCTCHNGECVSCDNFPCNPIDDCSTRIGCKCSGSKCVGDDKSGDCTDILNIIKDDSQCSIKGYLQKTECCSCSPLTFDVKGKRNSEASLTYNMSFIAELRKGAYDGGLNNPRLDDTNNDNIAINEPPTAGVVRMLLSITWANYIWNEEGQFWQFNGYSIDENTYKDAAFLSDGSSGYVEFSPTNIPKIGVRQTVDSVSQKEASTVSIIFTQVSDLEFPNKCIYDTGALIGEYTIVDNSMFLDFGTDYTNHIATTITSDICRDPFFKWSKDGEVVRKAYISGSGNIYEDLITRPPYDWLESCSNYTLDVDCSCEKAVGKTISFCNPAVLDFTLSECNTKFVLNSFNTCTPNNDKTFYIKGGDLDISFLGSNPPVGAVYTSNTCISSIEWGLTCDTQCTKTISSPCPTFNVTLETTCDANNSTFTITVPNTVTDKTGRVYNVDRLEFSTYVITPGVSTSIPVGTYNALLYLTEGCDAIPVTISEDCCTLDISTIARTCEGGVECIEDVGVVYTLDGVVQNDICAAVNGLPLDQGAQVKAIKGNCNPITFNLQPLGSFCCDNFSWDVQQVTNTYAILNINNALGTITVEVDGDTEVVVTDLGDNRFSLTNFDVDLTYTITVTDSICGTITDNWLLSDCVGEVTLHETSDCKLYATITPQSCTCRVGKWNIEITNAVDNGDNMDIYFKHDLDQLDANPVGANLYYEFNGNKVSLGTITSIGEYTGNFTVVKPMIPPVIQTCFTSIILEAEIPDSIVSGPCANNPNCLNVELAIFSGGVNIVSLPDIVSYSITVEDQLTGVKATKTSHNGNGIFIMDGIVDGPFTPVERNFNVEVEMTDGDSKVYTMSTVIAMQFGVVQSFTAPDICPEGESNENVTLAIRFGLENIILEDDCVYPTVSQLFSVFAGGVYTPSTTQVVSMTAVEPNTRDTKFIWLKDDVGVFEEFNETQSVLPESLLEQGSDYKVIADCAPCSDSSDELLYCCLPEITFDIQEPCNSGLSIFLTGYPGTYKVEFLTYTYYVTLYGPGETTDSVSHSIALPDDITINVTVSVEGTTCSEERSIMTYPVYIPELEFTNCDAGTGRYGINIRNADTGAYTTIISGTGDLAANGVDIVNCDELDPPVFNVTLSTGCVSANYLGSPPFSCSVSSSVAGSSAVLPSVSASPSSSPDPSSSGFIFSSSRIASSSPVESSSDAGSTGGTSSSSVPVSSSPVESSSNPESSSNVASSSVPVSSSPVPSSSNPESSSITIIPPSSSPTPSVSSNPAFSVSSVPSSSLPAESSSPTGASFFWFCQAGGSCVYAESGPGTAYPTEAQCLIACISSSQPAQSSSPIPGSSSQALGACCQLGGSCSITTAADCVGSWKGAGTVCTPDPCNSSGAASSSNVATSPCSFEGQACGNCGICESTPDPEDPWICVPVSPDPCTTPLAMSIIGALAITEIGGGGCCLCTGGLVCDCGLCEGISSSVPGV